ncbi:MAG: hypothetical protein N2C14_07275, partial [Planctomycetales bacterium]
AETDLEVACWKYEVPDFDELVTLLGSDSRFITTDVDRSVWLENEEVPPFAIHQILDRDPPDVESLSADNVPRIVGTAFLYGKTTDAEARLEFHGPRVPGSIEARDRFVELAGKAMNPDCEEETVDEISSEEHQLSPNFWFPPELPQLEARALANQLTRTAMFETWPKLLAQQVGAETIQDAVADPAARVKILGRVQLFQYVRHARDSSIDFDELRTQLGLEPESTIELGDQKVGAVPLVRMSRVNPENLSADNLLQAYARCSMCGARSAIRNFGRELLKRTLASPDDPRINLRSLYMGLIQVESDAEDKLKLIEQAREHCGEEREDRANWELAELPMRLVRGQDGDAERASALVDSLLSNYNDLPEVRDAVFRLFLQ